MMIAGDPSMLSDERTTHRHELPLPSEAEGLIVAPDRTVARPLVAFLRAQGLIVRTADDADAAFEEALLHPPDVVLVDDRVPPTGAIDLCTRLKDNVRTHFVPVIVFALSDLRSFRIRALAAGADAIFTPSTDAQERRARLWALLRTRALYKEADRRQRSQKSEIVERRHWLSHFLHDLTGQVAALAPNLDSMTMFAPPPADRRRSDFDESVSDARGVFERLKATMRTVIDYDRFETGQLVPRETRFVLGEAAAEVVEELQRHASMADKLLRIARPPEERPLDGDRELLVAAMLNLGLGALRRVPSRGTLSIEITETDTGMRFRAEAPGAPLMPGEKLRIFEPYGRRAGGSATYGMGLALAHAVIGLHDGSLWVEELENRQGCAFVFELRWQRVGGRTKRGARGGGADLPRAGLAPERS
jgi:signal transduction histidine kinase